MHEQTKVFGLVAQMNLKTIKKLGKVVLHKHFQEHLASTSTNNIDADARFPGAADVGSSTSSSSMKKYGFRPSMVYFSTC